MNFNLKIVCIFQVYAHFYVPEEVGSQFLVHRKALMRVTDLVKDRMRIADSSIAVLSGNVVEGVRPGRTEIQVGRRLMLTFILHSLMA